MTSVNRAINVNENAIGDARRATIKPPTRRTALGPIKGPNVNQGDAIKDHILKDSKLPGAGGDVKKIAAVRPALGDIGNKKESVAPKADPYKDVKPRVDCWKKEAVPVAKQIVTRASAKLSQENVKPVAVVAAAATGLVRPQALATQRSALTRQSVRAKITELPKPVRVVQQPLIKSRTPQKAGSVEFTESFLQTHSAQMLARVEDIDERDTNNPQLVSEYANDIYSYLYKLEREFPIQENFLQGHAEVNAKMRGILIDWINEVHLQFRLEIESYHMAVSIIDRFLQVAKKIERKQLQLVGVTALFFATKYEELFPPALTDFTYICDDCYKADEILDMERKLFRTLNFNLAKPLSIHFLRRFSKAAKGDDRHHVLAKYIMELATVDYALSHKYPSEIAAASLYLALKVFPIKHLAADSLSQWTPTLMFYSRYDKTHLLPIVKRLAELVREAPTSKLKAVYFKYSSSKFDAIAKHAALTGSTILQDIIDA